MAEENTTVLPAFGVDSRHGSSQVLLASERLAAARSIEDVVEMLRNTARAAVGAAGIAVILNQGGRCVYVAEDAVSPLWQGQHFPNEACISGWAMRHRQTVAISDVRLDTRIPQEAYAPTFVRSLIMVPIGSPDPIAALGAYWPEVVEHEVATIERMESLARLATIAIENARLTYARDRAASLGAAQNRILQAGVVEAPLAVSLEAIVREVEQLSTTGVLASILILDADGKRLRHGAAPSLPKAHNDAIDGLAIGPDVGSCGAAIFRNEPVFVANIATDVLWKDFRDLAVEYDLGACWSMPIRSSKGEVLGTFEMYHREPREPQPEDLEIVDFVLGTAGLVIERASAEQRLRRSEARYRQIVEGVEDFAIVTFDAEGMVTGWNSGAVRVVGYRTEDAIGRRGDFFYTAEDQAEGVFEREIGKARKEGRAVNERWHMRAQGSRFWGSGLLMPLALDHGGFVKIFRDRTTEHEAEAALHESEARLRFFETLDSRLMRARRAEDAMQAATEVLGLELGASRCAYADVHEDMDRFWIRSDFSAPGIASSVGAYSLDLFGPRAAAEMRAGQVLIVRNVRQELAPGEGREMFLSIGIDAIVCCPLIKDGRLAAMMAVHQDRPRDWTAAEIALVREVVERCWAHVERVGAEARLRESEERLRLAVEGADIGFWDVDIVNDILIWPARTKAMFGISPDVPVTMDDFYGGLHPDDLEATSAAFAAAADPTKRAIYDVDYRTIGKEDGIVRWIAAKGRGVFDEAGRCLRVAGTVVEITARKEAEEALRELNATLEARVAEAVADREAAQEALRQSQKMEAMGQLTGGVAHDFNNLLTPIVGALDLLQRKALGGEREQRLIAGAAQSAERAKTLVQRLLAFARRQPLQAVPVDVAGLVRDMGELIGSTTGPQINVVVEAPDGLPAATADPNQLEMAILNLAVNARDAMPEGGALRITASAELVASGHRSKLPAGQYICLSVADTGTGMDERTLARAVEPFFSTKGVGKGTGLGLSMVHGLASQLNGSLTIRSRLGAGTNVELWLPRSMAVPAMAADEPSTSLSMIARGTALLVDDEELVRASTADMLHDLGYTVIEAACGEEAVQILEAGVRPDLVVTDHLMPGISGTDLGRLIHASRPGTPVLLVSGYAERKGLGPELPRLIKPFRKDELAASLARLVK
ncbi:GAF domain-containing protein [Sphingomonas morindae]|uniref:histidine kinase n=1 Tax=Sphingomonas morindae TaxID=1541170 RepID=A0ABY4X876_9SPHN|nr:GAF domain-containing protein [Sphingomonas morindae]USI72876.1 GAF domain-containing protein [Sphingomonas morindae]